MMFLLPTCGCCGFPPKVHSTCPETCSYYVEYGDDINSWDYVCGDASVPASLDWGSGNYTLNQYPASGSYGPGMEYSGTVNGGSGFFEEIAGIQACWPYGADDGCGWSARYLSMMIGGYGGAPFFRYEETVYGEPVDPNGTDPRETVNLTRKCHVTILPCAGLYDSSAYGCTVGECQYTRGFWTISAKLEFTYSRSGVASHSVTYRIGRTVLSDSWLDAIVFVEHEDCAGRLDVPQQEKHTCYGEVSPGCDEPTYPDFHLPPNVLVTVSDSGVTVSLDGSPTVYEWQSIATTGDGYSGIPADWKKEFSVLVNQAESCCFTDCDYETNLCCNPLP